MAGLAGSIILIPPKRTTDVGPQFPMSPGIVLWYCSAVISIPQFLIGLPTFIGRPKDGIVPSVLGLAVIYTFLISYLGDFLLLVFRGVVCGCSRLCFRRFGRTLGADDWLGFAVWAISVSRAILLACWGPFMIDL